MRIVSILFLFIFSGLQTVNSQSIEKHIRENTKPIASNLINSGNMDDLQVIGDAIGDATVVLLGEQDHGDAPSFQAKARLIKYLNEVKGFDVVAFESDFFSLVEGEKIRQANDGSKMKLMKENIFTIWTKCDECQDVFNYIDTSKAFPVTVTGFDNQLHGEVRRKDYRKVVEEALRPINSQWIDTIGRFLDMIQQYYPNYMGWTGKSDSMLYYDRILDSIIAELADKPDSMYGKILIRSLKGYLQQGINMQGNYARANRVRDEAMADNFMWLRKYMFPGKKIIIWAHNYHIARNTMTAFPSKSGRHVSMGSLLGEQLKDSMYVIGFTSFDGQAGRNSGKVYKVNKPEKKSVETWMAATGNDYAFVDLKSFRLTHPFFKEEFQMKGKSHESAAATWTDVFDGVFYIRNMFPCKRN